MYSSKSESCEGLSDLSQTALSSCDLQKFQTGFFLGPYHVLNVFKEFLKDQRPIHPSRPAGFIFFHHIQLKFVIFDTLLVSSQCYFPPFPSIFFPGCGFSFVCITKADETLQKSPHIWQLSHGFVLISLSLDHSHHTLASLPLVRDALEAGDNG